MACCGKEGMDIEYEKTMNSGEEVVLNTIADSPKQSIQIYLVNGEGVMTEVSHGATSGNDSKSLNHNQTTTQCRVESAPEKCVSSNMSPNADQDVTHHTSKAQDIVTTAVPSLSLESEKTKLINQSEFKLLYVDIDAHCRSMVSNSIAKNDSRPKKSVFKHSKLKQRKHSKHSKLHKPRASFPETVLPEHLKTKRKIETNSVIDLTQREVKPIMENTFAINEEIDYKVYMTLNKSLNLCCFCAKPANYASLDALFGAYELKVENTSTVLSQLDSTVQVWLHRDCALWTPSICLRGSSLVGLGPALNDAANMKCYNCLRIGATLKCSHSHCEKIFHYFCGKRSGLKREPRPTPRESLKAKVLKVKCCRLGAKLAKHGNLRCRWSMDLIWNIRKIDRQWQTKSWVTGASPARTLASIRRLHKCKQFKSIFNKCCETERIANKNFLTLLLARLPSRTNNNDNGNNNNNNDRDEDNKK
eukprot:gene8739-9672_t